MCVDYAVNLELCDWVDIPGVEAQIIWMMIIFMPAMREVVVRGAGLRECFFQMQQVLPYTCNTFNTFLHSPAQVITCGGLFCFVHIIILISFTSQHHLTHTILCAIMNPEFHLKPLYVYINFLPTTLLFSNRTAVVFITRVWSHSL